MYLWAGATIPARRLTFYRDAKLNPCSIFNSPVRGLGKLPVLGFENSMFYVRAHHPYVYLAPGELKNLPRHEGCGWEVPKLARCQQSYFRCASAFWIISLPFTADTHVDINNRQVSSNPGREARIGELIGHGGRRGGVQSAPPSKLSRGVRFRGELPRTHKKKPGLLSEAGLGK